MFPSSKTSPSRKASRTATKRKAKDLPSRLKSGLALDTSFSRHLGQEPQEVFPYDSTNHASRNYRISSVRKRSSPRSASKKASLRSQLENLSIAKQSPAPINSISSPENSYYRPITTSTSVAHVREDVQPPENRQSILQPPLSKRVKGLRPSPLDLDGVSPSDQAISIGISVPSATMTQHTESPLSATPSSQPLPQQHNYQSKGFEPTTPMIVVTPAREEFGLFDSPEVLHASKPYRVSSSVYSRYTTGIPWTAEYEKTPPVPPLPLMVQKMRHDNIRAPNARSLEGLTAAPRNNTSSICTVFEEDVTSPVQDNQPPPPSSRKLTKSWVSTPGTGTGWWNVITSPFSGTSNALFWRSPTDDEPDRRPILHDQSGMGVSDRGLADDEIRSAPATDSRRNSNMPIPKRSVTAPGAIHSDTPRVDIHWIPDHGEAASYYDTSRHFPSLIVVPEALPRSVFDDDTPLTDVCRCEHGHGHDRGCSMMGAAVHPSGLDADEMEHEKTPNPFDDVHETKKQNSKGLALFATPDPHEMDTPPTTRRMPDRSVTQHTEMSQLSPLTATPIVEDAQIARVIAPRGAGPDEQRGGVIAPVSIPSPMPARGLQNATMASRSVEHSISSETTYARGAETQQYRPTLHSRSSSYGLGISSGERELYPPPPVVTEKHYMSEKSHEKSLRPKRPWFRRFLWPLIALVTCLVTLMVVLLVLYVPQKHDDMPVQGQWVNLTGYPPLPSGVTTIIQPNNVRSANGCVNPAGLWSCDASKEEQVASGVKQPNFRFEIRFKNDSTIDGKLLQSAASKRSGVPAAASLWARSHNLQSRDTWSDAVYSPSPSPPSTDDQIFLGQMTDNNTAPYDGEATPFYLSLLDAVALSNASVHKREDQTFPYPTPNGPTNTTQSSTNASISAPQNIPRPATRPDGSPAPATLYPYAHAQPLRLYKRGRSDEHYGFYAYFDRSIYVANSSTAGTLVSNVPLANASAVCTWAQTRVVVQIWTRGGTVGSSAGVASMGSTSASGVPAGNSTANAMGAPGSFPYAVTVTLDRHGGDAGRKGVYCHGIDGQHVQESVKMWITEDRGHGGSLTNAAQVPSDGGQHISRRDGGGYGGIDGGNGGCACAWQNWK